MLQDRCLWVSMPAISECEQLAPHKAEFQGNAPKAATYLASAFRTATIR
jgi:hypothetical protein